MDPVTLTITALAAGTAAGIKDSASTAIKDAYSSLRELVSRKLKGHHDGELVLTRHQEAPEVWEGPLIAELTTAGVADDAAIVAAAQALMNLIDQSGSQAGKYAVHIEGSHGVQVGDHNTQHNIFDGSN